MNIKFQTMRQLVRDLFNVGETQAERREVVIAFFSTDVYE